MSKKFLNKKTAQILSLTIAIAKITGLIGFFLIVLFVLGLKNHEPKIGLGTYPLSHESIAKLNALNTEIKFSDNLLTIKNNSLLPIANPLVVQKPKAKLMGQKTEPKVTQRIKMIITAYSSTVCQTDSTPFITASNSWVRKGIVANNFFPFGTRIRIPEYFGNKIFVIEDRMHWRKSNEHIDIWFPSKQEAINFGITKAYVEILAD